MKSLHNIHVLFPAFFCVNNRLSDKTSLKQGLNVESNAIENTGKLWHVCKRNEGK